MLVSLVRFQSSAPFRPLNLSFNNALAAALRTSTAHSALRTVSFPIVRSPLSPVDSVGADVGAAVQAEAGTAHAIDVNRCEENAGPGLEAAGGIASQRPTRDLVADERADGGFVGGAEGEHAPVTAVRDIAEAQLTGRLRKALRHPARGD